MSYPIISWAFEQDLSNRDKIVLLVLSNYADQWGTCFPSFSTLSKNCSMAVSTIQLAIKSLEAAGFVVVNSRSRDGARTSNLYRLVGDWKKWKKIAAKYKLAQPRRKKRENGYSESQEVAENFVEISGQKSVGGIPIIGKEPVNEYSDTTYLEEIADAPPPPVGQIEVSPAKQFWDESLGVLLELGLSDKQARSFIGKCLKTTGGKMDLVSAALNEASLVGTRDPIPYVTAILNNGGVFKKSEQKRKVDEAFAYLDARIAAEEAEWAARNATEAPHSLTGGKDDTGVLPPIPDEGPGCVRPHSGAGAGAIPGGSAGKGRFTNLRDFSKL